MSFVDKVLSLNHSPNFVKFRLNFYDPLGQLLSRTNGWIQAVISRSVVELELHIVVCQLAFEYLQIPPCQSLQVLKIDTRGCYGLCMPTSSGCFPNLGIFYVSFALFGTDDNKISTKLFTNTCLPRLEKLSFSGDLIRFSETIHFKITETALKNLDMVLYHIYGEDNDALVEIDAPHLECLHLEDNFLGSYLVKNQPAMCEAKLELGDYMEDSESEYYGSDVGHAYANRPIKLLQDICTAKSLSISSSTMRALTFARDNNLPVFHSLTKLELHLYPTGGWNLLPHWLEKISELRVSCSKRRRKRGRI